MKIFQHVFLSSHYERMIFILTLVFISNYTMAMRVKPMIMEIQPTGSSAQVKMSIENTSNSPLTIEVIPTRIEISETGVETNDIAADDELLILPMTAVIKPNRSQVVMVRYIGDPEIIQSKAYSIAIKQMPIDLGGESAIAFVSNFNTLLNVAPKQARAQLSVKSLDAISSDHWLIKIENNGDKYARLSNTQWTITGNQQQNIKLNGSQLEKKIKGNLILPRSTRVFEMTPIEGISPRNSQIQINTKQ